MGNLFDLPHALLLLIASSSWPVSAVTPWPYNLPSHVKYFPEDEAHMRKELSIEQRLSTETPIGMKKMSGDGGEKFWLEYWQFEDFEVAEERMESRSLHADGLPRLKLESRAVSFPDSLNDSSSDTILPPLRPLIDGFGVSQKNLYLLNAGNVFEKRSFQCPAGTDSCDDIGRPNSCCAIGETCVRIRDTGLGDVGCCPSRSDCGGSISTCNEEEGYTSCPNSPNGGCCIPGFVCKDVGCVGAETTILPTPTTSTSIAPPPPTTTSSSTKSSTPPPSTTSSLTCSLGFHSCGPNHGGGCCRNGFACRTDGCESSTPSTTTSGTAVPPVRPTSNSITISTTSSTSLKSLCPTGYYMCSAYYRGGCCQVDRNCDSTSCPTPATATVVDSNGVTVAAPTGVTTEGALATGSCADGWFNCGANSGGGCCPSGYKCGDQCTATKGGRGSVVAKEAPSGANAAIFAWSLMMVTFVAGMGMILL